MSDFASIIEKIGYNAQLAGILAEVEVRLKQSERRLIAIESRLNQFNPGLLSGLSIESEIASLQCNVNDAHQEQEEHCKRLAALEAQGKAAPEAKDKHCAFCKCKVSNLDTESERYFELWNGTQQALCRDCFGFIKRRIAEAAKPAPAAQPETSETLYVFREYKLNPTDYCNMVVRQSVYEPATSAQIKAAALQIPELATAMRFLEAARYDRNGNYTDEELAEWLRLVVKLLEWENTETVLLKMAAVLSDAAKEQAKGEGDDKG